MLYIVVVDSFALWIVIVKWQFFICQQKQLACILRVIKYFHTFYTKMTELPLYEKIY
jgi:hypothetical protein